MTEKSKRPTLHPLAPDSGVPNRMCAETANELMDVTRSGVHPRLRQPRPIPREPG